MKISEIGGEFELIKMLTKNKYANPKIVKGIGDDCAVLKCNNEQKYLLVTTDMMVEEDHFNLNWHTPFQIGMKLLEVNVSDIVSMGGTPTFALLSMSLPSSTTVEFMTAFYDGLYKSAERHNVFLIGGDTTHGSHFVFNIVLLGEISPNLLRLRSMAQVGDLICVTGKLGQSTAGLRLLLKEKKGYVKAHLEPKSRVISEGKVIASYANAMIDVSDGLGSEVTHICNESNTGACIINNNIPLDKSVIEAANKLGDDPYDYALYGGEDFEIVFTINKNKLKALSQEFFDFTVVGQIIEKEKGVYLLKDDQKLPIKKGYDHFA